jgi:ribosomal protein S18 acetylase RimI-like enzyme
MKLEKMTQIDFEIWAPRSRQGYVEDKIKANGLTKNEAQEIAEKDFTRLLPDGLSSKDNYLYTMKNSDSTVVGYLWFCIRGAVDNRKAFLCDIVVNENYRGQGIGKSAMLQLEQEVKKLSLKEIGLHVFGFNEKAIRLYQSLGFRTTDLVMSKSL